MNGSKNKNLGGVFQTTPLEGQHALITGGSRGIGAAISNALAALGANISLLARDKETLEIQTYYSNQETNSTQSQP